jgi:hypothetical protein
MLRMIDQIETRLNLLRMTARDKLTAAGVDPDATPTCLQRGSHSRGGQRPQHALLFAERTAG